ncbi:NACHT domain-containing protein [Streptomyces sp. NPDC059874]|uniref:NACHT domain-containing protein n=1 Tax=Streptomyces sp. NPDC059874 TaxID=3346983 RepID=UPI003661EAC5
MRRPWGRAKAARTVFGDVDISGYFAAGRDVNVRNFTISESLLGKTDVRIRKKMLTKVLPAWLREGDYWAGDSESGIEFPVAAEFSTDHVSGQRQGVTPISRRTAVKQWDSVDISQALDGSSGKLLILGESGSGKTRSLQQVMHLSIGHALRDDQNPIPFLLHLSDWSNSDRELRIWLMRSIRENYGILPGMFTQWLDRAEVMIILDGLDELKLRDRRDCITAINRFVSEYPTVQVVVACRLDEYRDTGRRLNLRASLLIERVSERKVAEIVNEAGGALEGLDRALRKDRKLRDLLRNPLFLRLAMTLYSESADVDLSRSTDRRKALLAAYVDYAERRMAGNGVQSEGWLYFMAFALRGKQRVMFCPDRYSVEFLPIKFKRLAETRVLLMASLLVAVPSFLLRGAMILLAPDSPTKATYVAITFFVPLSYGFLTWRITKDDLWSPLAGRRTSVVRGLLRFARRSVIISLLEGAAVWSLVTSGAAVGVLGGIVLLAFVGVTMWPALQMVRESDTSDPSEIPDRAGGEIRSLVRSTLIVAALVAVSMYVTLAVIFEALSPVPVVSEGLLYAPMLNAFFFIVPVAFIAALRNGGVDLIRRDQCRRIMIQFGYLPKNHKASLEEIRKSSLVVPRRGALEFKHVLIRDHLSHRFGEDATSLSFVPIRETVAKVD